MGEAVYYCKIFFKDNENALRALKPVRSFFREGVRAHNYWQSNRGKEKSQTTFWLDFGKKFPTVSLYLKEINLFDGGKNNELSGKLDFGELDNIDLMDVAEDCIFYSSMVWHFAEWDEMLQFIVRHYGAEESSWISDEYTNHFDLCTRGGG